MVPRNTNYIHTYIHPTRLGYSNKVIKKSLAPDYSIKMHEIIF
jgi:hypothetical protein